MSIMKTITIYGLTMIFLVGLTTSASAQSNVAPTEQEAIRDARRQANDADSRWSMMQSFWDSDALFIGVPVLLHRREMREGLGISEEQNRRIQEAAEYIFTTFRAEDPDYRSLRQEWNNCDLTTEEGRKRHIELQIEMRAMIRDKEASLIRELLTPEQIRKVKEFHISTMSEGMFVSPNILEALDISDEQKSQVDEIRREIESEVEAFVDKHVAVYSRYNVRIGKITDEMLTIDESDREARLRLINDATRNLRVEFQPEINELREINKDLANNLKVRMFDVLTDEQWERMLDLIDNPPDYIKRWISQFREAMERDNTSTGTWQPGPGSWRPGDPIPEGYRIERERRSRFPTSE